MARIETLGASELGTASHGFGTDSAPSPRQEVSSMTALVPVTVGRLGVAFVAAVVVAACANGVADEGDPSADTSETDAGPRTIPSSDGSLEGDSTPSSPPPSSPDASAGGADTSAPSPDAAAPADASTAVDAGTTSDASAPPPPPSADAGPVAVPDAAPPGPTCSPAVSASVTPTWHTEKGRAGDCYPSEIDSFWTACLDAAATTSTCSAYANGLSTGYCYDCLVSASTESSWGAIVTYTGYSDFNVGGCYDLAGASSACSHAVQYQFECDVAYCGKSCGTKSDADYTSCIGAANASGGACATYTSDRASKCAGVSAAVKASCDPTSDTKASFTSIGTVFCGP